MLQIHIDVTDDSILVIDHGPIPLARRQRDPKGSHRHPLHAGRYRHRPPMPGNRIDVLGNVHITPNVRDVHDPQLASNPTVHHTWRLPREQTIAI
jgi:hypothetical protein